MKWILPVAVGGVIVLAAAGLIYVVSTQPSAEQDAAQDYLEQLATPVPGAQVMAIREVQSTSQPAGIYTINGFIARRHTCPPCPEEWLCEPCGPESIVTSETRRELADTAPLTEHEILVQVDLANVFSLGKRYTLTVQKNTYPSSISGQEDQVQQEFKLLSATEESD